MQKARGWLLVASGVLGLGACSSTGADGAGDGEGAGGSSGGALTAGGNAAGGGVLGGGSGGLASVGGSITSGGTSSGGTSAGGPPGPDDGRQIFLLIGQSNMEGVPLPEAADQVTNPNIEVLGYDASCKGRTWNTWGVASPPLHRCWAGVGPGDGFAKALAESWPDAKIGLVPCAISGVDIDYFRKDVVSARRSEFSIPPDNSYSGAYQMVIDRARVAQQTGVIRGILFHQGESDSGSPTWVGKVEEIVADLKEDLDLPDDLPFVAGELYYQGCCKSHNTLVQQLPGVVPSARVVSASGLTGVDNFHFDLSSQREFGKRYAAAFLDALGP